MTTVVAISGAQGTGKSTTIELLEKEHNRRIDDFKASRSVMQSMGTSIEEFSGDSTKMMEFQEQLLCAKIQNDSVLKVGHGRNPFSNKTPVVIVERSLIDLAAYAIEWTNNQEFDAYSIHQWCGRYVDRCLLFNKVLYDRTYILPSGMFEMVYDGVRAKADSQDSIHRTLVRLSLQNGDDWQLVQGIDPKERAEYIDNNIRTYLDGLYI